MSLQLIRVPEHQFVFPGVVDVPRSPSLRQRTQSRHYTNRMAEQELKICMPLQMY